MVFSSPYPTLDIPQTNLLSYLFENGPVSDEPLWLDSKDAKKNLSPQQLLQGVKRLGFGLERLGLKKGDVVMICTPNSIFVPVAYLGIVGAGYIFSGANPSYTVPGMTWIPQSIDFRLTCEIRACASDQEHYRQGDLGTPQYARVRPGGSI